MGKQMRVDLSELEETVRKLNRVASDMGDTHGDSAYRTYLPKGAVGSGFQEAEELAGAHTEMKQHLEEIIGFVKGVIDEFGTNAKKVHGRYQEAEYEAKHGVSGDGGKPGGGMSGGMSGGMGN